MQLMMTNHYFISSSMCTALYRRLRHINSRLTTIAANY